MKHHRAALIAAVLLLAASTAMAASQKVVLVITADQTDYVLAAGGTIAAMIEDGARPGELTGQQHMVLYLYAQCIYNGIKGICSY